MNRNRLTAALVLSAVVVASPALARDQLRIVGSSTVYPFSTAVAEQFGKQGKFKTPVVESTGTGGGMRLFCSGVGPDHPDLTNASRRIKTSEVEFCAKNGVTDIIEMKIGFDGIVLANSKKSKRVSFTRNHVYLALAKDIPQGGKLVPNPYKTWNEVDPALPNVKIEVLGPPPTSGTRDSFNEMMMEGGCKQNADMKALNLDEKAHAKACQTIREDGAYIEAGENDNLIVQKLDANPSAFGAFGYSFLDQNGDKIQGSLIDGQDPAFETIASAKYPVSRAMFVYAKKAHVGQIPGIKEYMTEYSSEKAWGKAGYLADKGLIPMVDDERKEWAGKVSRLENLKM